LRSLVIEGLLDSHGDSLHPRAHVPVAAEYPGICHASVATTTNKDHHYSDSVRVQGVASGRKQSHRRQLVLSGSLVVTEPVEELAAFMRRARAHAQLSQDEVARVSGLSVRALRDLERGRVRKPHEESLRRLVAVLGVDGSDLDRILTSVAQRPRPGLGEQSSPLPAVTVDILGTLRLCRDGAEVPVSGAVPRAVLGLAALRLGRPVTREEIVDALWGDRPPVSWVNQVHTAVGQLRRLLDPGRARGSRTGLLALDRTGYVLGLEADAVDLHRFSRRFKQACAGVDGAARDEPPSEVALEAALVTLDAALSDWRGPVLSGELVGVSDHTVALAAAGQRLEAALLLADLALRLRRADLAIEHLRPLARAEPYHEGLHARLILALAARGEQAAALECFAAVRTQLITDLGIEPGPQLRRAQALVLDGEHARALDPRFADSGREAYRGPDPTQDHWATPHMLPADLPDFTGREQELNLITELLTGTGDSADPPVRRPVVAIAGMAGVGKTALIVHAAHRLAPAHPDGQLYINLRGADDATLRPADVLARFLRATGVDGPAIPQDVASREDMYRSRTAQRRLLIVLDNASSAAQLRPLLPGGTGCSVLISARTRLTAREGARWIALDVLPFEQSLALLGRVAGPDRVRTDRAGAAEIIQLCGNLPLAVRIAGARLAEHPSWPTSRLAVPLRQERQRLDQLTVGDLAVRASMEFSYRELRPRARLLFRLLGLLDAPDFPARVAGAVLGTPAADALDPLTELVDANLITETDPDEAGQLRYRFHDLVRLYARERAEAEDAAEVTEVAVRRALGAWLTLAERFARAVPGPCYAPITGSAERPDLADLTDFAQVDPLRWFDAEQSALRASVHQACRSGLDELAYELAGSMEKYFDLRGMYEEWRATNEQVLHLCQARGNSRGEAVMLRGLIDVRTWNTVHDGGDGGTAMGRMLADALRLAEMFERLAEPSGRSDAEVAAAWGYCAAGDVRTALSYARRALDLAQGAGHLGGIARAHVALALTEHFTPGGGAGTLDHLDQALVAARALGNARYEASVLQFLGIAHAALGDAARSGAALDESLAVSRRYSDRFTEVLTLLALARLHLATGDPRARSEIETSLALGRRFTMPHHVADALTVLGQLALASGDATRAVAYLSEAVEMWRTRGWPRYLAEALTACGAAHREVGDPGAAQKCWTEAADLFTTLSDEGAANQVRDLLTAGTTTAAPASPAAVLPSGHQLERYTAFAATHSGPALFSS
jgi:DNA-binding SARP family transcriptional activator/tetratricopeptide (TPR) repeat protein/DNA-binding transcriptional regulator YiaG